jgi:hypothetical protein
MSDGALGLDQSLPPPREAPLDEPFAGNCHPAPRSSSRGCGRATLASARPLPGTVTPVAVRSIRNSPRPGTERLSPILRESPLGKNWAGVQEIRLSLKGDCAVLTDEGLDEAD